MRSTSTISRRDFLRASSLAVAVLALPRRAAEAEIERADPWPKGTLMEPAALVALLRRGTRNLPRIFCVGFPEVYKKRHIPHAQFAGLGSTPEGLTTLRETVAHLSKATPIVLYCGCCPIRICPNAHPAFQLLQRLGFRHVRVLNLPKDFHTDWEAKGYPVTSA